jgi:hypothetical protein
MIKNINLKMVFNGYQTKIEASNTLIYIQFKGKINIVHIVLHCKYKMYYFVQ